MVDDLQAKRDELKSALDMVNAAETARQHARNSGRTVYIKAAGAVCGLAWARLDAATTEYESRMRQIVEHADARAKIRRDNG